MEAEPPSASTMIPEVDIGVSTGPTDGPLAGPGPVDFFLSFTALHTVREPGLDGDPPVTVLETRVSETGPRPFDPVDPTSLDGLLSEQGLRDEASRVWAMGAIADLVLEAVTGLGPGPAHRVDVAVAINFVSAALGDEEYDGGDVPVAFVAADEGAVRESLKRVRAGDYLGGKEGGESCSVCLEEVGGEEEVTCLPCDHWFHEGCIVKWLETSHYCPLCRYELPVTATKKRRCT